MRRSARTLTLLNSHLLITAPVRCTPSLSSVASSTRVRNFTQLSTSNNVHHSAITYSSGSREPHVPKTAMDSDSAAHPPEMEPFIHVDSTNANHMSGEDSDQSVVSFDEDRGTDVSREREGVFEGEQRRRVIPEELSRSVMMLSCESSAEGGNCDVYLVGTAHVSMESCQEVQAVISYLKPEVVFLELCSSRVAVLSPQNLKVANKLEVFPGSEFRVAFEEAMKYGGKVILGDRPVNITLRRTWGKMPLWHKTKLLYSLLFQAFFLPNAEDLNRMLKEMDDVDMLTLVIQEMSKEFPTLMETLVHERDKYMSSKLLRVASEHSSVVAVVGKGHLQGIKKHWKQPVEVNELLDMMPSQKPVVSVAKILSTVGVTIAGVAIISGIYLSTRK
ncbi:hypothetical protein LguiA_035255 [Lonicera macranthoides]